MDYEIFVTPGLGDNSYLIASQGEAVIVDPQRDAWRFLAVAEAKQWRIRYVLETHVHNDYLSGALEVRRATGAEIGAPAQGGYALPYVKLAEGDAIQVGALRFIALETPGHTWEHTSYAVHEDIAPDPAVVLTGGSLIVGSSGRTDLLGEAHTPSHTRAQYHTLKRLAALPEATRVLPTHGAGSFCTAAVPSMDRTTTIAQERQHNPALAAPDEEAFVRERLTGLLAYPAYYAHMAPLNRQGPAILERLPGLAAMMPEDDAHAVQCLSRERRRAPCHGRALSGRHRDTRNGTPPRMDSTWTWPNAHCSTRSWPIFPRPPVHWRWGVGQGISRPDSPPRVGGSSGSTVRPPWWRKRIITAQRSH